MQLEERDVDVVLKSLAQRFLYLAADIKNANKNYNERAVILALAGQIMHLSDKHILAVFKRLVDEEA